MCVSSNSLEPLGQLKYFMWHHHGIGEKWKDYSNDLGHLKLFIIVNRQVRGQLAGILAQIWLRKAGLLAGFEN